MGSPSLHQSEVLARIEGKVSVFPYFQHFSGVFKGESYDSDLPPGKAFFNKQTLLDHLKTGAVSLLGKVGEVQTPISFSP